MAIQLKFKSKQQTKHPTAFKQAAAEPAFKIQGVWMSAVFGETVDIGGEGHTHTFSWPGVSGATSVDINSASIRAGSASVEELEPFTIADNDQRIDVKVGTGKAVRTLKLNGFEGIDPLDGSADFKALHSSNDVSSQNLKLLISVTDPNGAFTPFFSIPAVSAKGVFPQSYTGASFNSDTITFHAPLAAETIRIQLVRHDFPEETASQTLKIGSVGGTYLTLPRNMKISLDDGSILFEFPGDMPLESPDVTVPLIQPLIDQFQQKLDADEEISSTLTIEAAASDGSQKAMAQVAIADPAGFLVRKESGVHTTTLAGHDTPLNIPTEIPLADEAPVQATADVSIVYDGMKILPDLSSAVPLQNGNISGQVVAAARKLKALPPAALSDRRLARIGIIGRTPEDCELVLELVDMTGGVPGATLLDPVVLSLRRDHRLGIHWFSFPDRDPMPVPLGVGLRANVGRFFWVGHTDPLIRVAIYDDDPGTEATHLGDQLLVNGDLLPFTAASFALPAMLFSGEMPLLRSDLFLTVDIADLALRYAR
jgi:hypothetical protein